MKYSGGLNYLQCFIIDEEENNTFTLKIFIAALATWVVLSSEGRIYQQLSNNNGSTCVYKGSFIKHIESGDN